MPIEIVFDQCARRGCGWIGPMQDRLALPDKECVVCPNCGNDSFYRLKPLFLPLKSHFFQMFKDGTKNTEYRTEGNQFNVRRCQIGRCVTLSRGYSGERISGVIVGCKVDYEPEKLPGWTDCYGKHKGPAVCIEIALT